MKKVNSSLSVSLILLFTFILGGCSADRSGDMREIFKTIPSDVSFVVAVDAHKLLEEAGCKVKDGTIRPGKKIREIFADSANLNLKTKSEVVINAGIDPSYIVLFTEGYNSYLTGFISDTDHFRNLIENKFGEKVMQNGDLSICGNVAFSSNRFWICVTSRNTININDVKHFSTLSEKQSFLSLEASARLEESDKIMRGWGDIRGCLNASGMDFSTRASVLMAFEALFEDAVEFSFNLDFDKDKFSMGLTLMNTKGGIAAFLYPSAKIDLDQVKLSGLSGDAMALMAVSPKFTERMREDTRGKGISVIGMLSGMLSDVSGTVMVASDGRNNISGIIPVKGNNTSDLNQLLSQYDFSVTQEKGTLRFSKGTCSGKITSEMAASVFIGKMGGMILSPGSITRGNIEYAALTLEPQKGGMELEIVVKGKSKESLLMALIESLAKYSSVNGN